MKQQINLVWPNNNGCGQYALIGVRLLFEGGHYNIQGLAGRRGLLFEGGDYSRAASDRGITVIIISECQLSILSYSVTRTSRGLLSLPPVTVP